MKIVARLWLGLISLALSATLTLANAEGIKSRQVQVEQTDANVLVNASFQIDFPQELEDAVKKGVIFHFVVNLNISHGRWYWFDEKPVQTEKVIRLSYQPLTQQYKVSGGGLTLSAFTLKEALIQVGSIGGWQVAELSALDIGKQYQVEIRMRLDLAKLPKPFQINALNAREWNLASDWQRFAFTPTQKAASNK